MVKFPRITLRGYAMLFTAISVISFVGLCLVLVGLARQEAKEVEPIVFIYPYDGKEYIVACGEGGSTILLHEND
jgi:hypothetical protein